MSKFDCLSREQVQAHPELAILTVLDSVLQTVMTALVAVHDLTDCHDETPYYLLPRTTESCIADCILNSAASLRQALNIYHHATTRQLCLSLKKPVNGDFPF